MKIKQHATALERAIAAAPRVVVARTASGARLFWRDSSSEWVSDSKRATRAGYHETKAQVVRLERMWLGEYLEGDLIVWVGDVYSPDAGS